MTLNPEALCVAAARGLAEAAAAAWPGEGPLPRLRRAAAELLARAAGPAAGPEGEHSMATGNLGHALKRQLGDGYRVAVDSVPGKKLWTALADHPDGPGLIQCDMQEVRVGGTRRVCCQQCMAFVAIQLKGRKQAFLPVCTKAC